MQRQHRISTSRAALFDWLSFLLGVTLSLLIPGLNADILSEVLLISLLTYALGAALKDQPLRHRLIREKRFVPDIPFWIFLVLGHWIIMLTAILLALPAFTRWTGLANPPGRIFTETPGYAISFFLSLALTWLVYRNKRRRLKKEPLPAEGLAVQEWIADILLWTGVGCLSFVFWDQALMGVLSAMPVNSIGRLFFVFFFFCLAYVLFYLPLRYLYLVEDYSDGSAWNRMKLIFAVLLVRILLPLVLG